MAEDSGNDLVHLLPRGVDGMHAKRAVLSQDGWLAGFGPRVPVVAGAAAFPLPPQAFGWVAGQEIRGIRH